MVLIQRQSTAGGGPSFSPEEFSLGSSSFKKKKRTIITFKNWTSRWRLQLNSTLRVHVPSANMEGAGLMAYTAASKQGAVEMFWLHFWGTPEHVTSSIFTVVGMNEWTNEWNAFLHCSETYFFLILAWGNVHGVILLYVFNVWLINLWWLVLSFNIIIMRVTKSLIWMHVIVTKQLLITFQYL